eukprot:128144_1
MGTETSKNTGTETSKNTQRKESDTPSCRSTIDLQESDIDTALPNLMRYMSEAKPTTGSRLIKMDDIMTPSEFSESPNSSISSITPIVLDTHETTVGNGVTGKLISTKICRIVAIFWVHNITSLPMDRKLEIACSIFCSMLSSNKEMRTLMDTKNIEALSLKYLDMIGWLTRSLMNHDIDLYSLLRKLGAMHRTMGIRIQHFEPMLVAMHQTFSYYFPSKYVIEVKYALDELFTLSAQIMSNQDLKHSPHLNDINGTLNNKNISFLQSLRACLESSIGSEYLTGYLQQTFCDEIAIFLQLIKKYRKQINDKQRFMIAREIVKSCIDPEAIFAVNISYETREAVLHDMDALERKFCVYQNCFCVPLDLFAQVEREVYRLIRVNHWGKFVDSIKSLQLKSNNL